MQSAYSQFFSRREFDFHSFWSKGRFPKDSCWGFDYWVWPRFRKSYWFSRHLTCSAIFNYRMNHRTRGSFMASLNVHYCPIKKFPRQLHCAPRGATPDRTGQANAQDTCTSYSKGSICWLISHGLSGAACSLLAIWLDRHHKLSTSWLGLPS